jgi:hypothetical protein
MQLEYVAGNVAELQHSSLHDYQEIFHHVSIVDSWKTICDRKVFDVCMEPLVEELVQLWKGVVAYNVLKDLDCKAFKL